MFVFDHMLGAEQLNIHTWVGAFVHKLTLYLPTAVWVHKTVTNIIENEVTTNQKIIYMIWTSCKIHLFSSSIYIEGH